jgi:hypothetical protein
MDLIRWRTVLKTFDKKNQRRKIDIVYEIIKKEDG